MPDASTITPEASPSAPPAAPESSGINKFMADFVTGMDNDKTPETPPQTPSPAPDKTAGKPATPTKADAPKDTPKPPPEKSTTPPAAKPEGASDLRRRLEEVTKQDKARASEIETLKKQNEDLGKRRFVTPEIEKEMEQNREEISRLKKERAEVAFERSDEFKQKYVEPYQQSLESAIAAASEYTIPTDDVGGSRKATKSDFLKVAGAHPSERSAVARQLFGDNALAVLADVRDLERLRTTANQAIKQHSEGFEARQKEESAKLTEHQKQYEGLRNLSRQQLVEKFPEYFGESADDPELTEAWKSGQEFVDRAANLAPEMPLEDRAAYIEVLRARAAAFPRILKQMSKVQSKVKELETELSKYRSSEPGNETEKAGDKKTDSDKPKGIKGMMAEFDNLG